MPTVIINFAIIEANVFSSYINFLKQTVISPIKLQFFCD